MLTIRLSPLDLEQIRIAPMPAPMIELGSFVRSLQNPALDSLRQARNLDDAGYDMEKLSTLTDLILPPWSPGFIFPALQNSEEAIHAVVSASPELVKRDISDGASEGIFLPSWVQGLTRSGSAGLLLRKKVGESLDYVFRRSIEPTLAGLRPAFSAHAKLLRETIESQGPENLLNSLHSGIRCNGLILEIDLASGVDVSYESRGSGMILVPSLGAAPSVTTSSDGLSPMVIVYPNERLRKPDAESERIRNLHALLGAGRATVLETVAHFPGLNTRALARRAGLSPASISEHSRILRANHLIVTRTHKNVAAHFVTDYGKALLGIYW